jgi:hypothetical protein
MKALFADITERERQRHRNRTSTQKDDRRQVHALFDAIQIAIAEGEGDRVSTLLLEIHAIVDGSLARRRRVS